MLPLRLSRSVQNLQRLQYIARVLTQHGFGHVVDRIDLGRFVPLRLRRSRHDAPSQHANIGRRLTQVASELGPMFVKLGQLLATRPDVVPPDILVELQTLQDRVEPFDTDEARQIIERELKVPIDEAYRSIGDKPLASGSIGQVYRASMPDGTPVIVKVRRPGVEEDIRNDLYLLKWLAEAIDRWVPEAKPYHPLSLVEEFERTLLREIDYMHEAATTSRLREAFDDDENIEIPEVYWSHSTPNLLTLGELDGVNVQRAIEQNGARLHRKDIAARLALMYLRQFFEIGTFHADPHPGNILIKPPARIGLIDFGQIGVISDAMIGNLLIMVFGAVHRDVDVICESLSEMDALNPGTDRKQLARDVQVLIDKYYGQPMRRLHVTSIFTEVTEIIRRHDVAVPRDVILMLKSMTTVWGVALNLDPDLNLVELLKPRLTKMVGARLTPTRTLRMGGLTAWHLMSFLKSGPAQLRQILRHISSGQWQLNVRHDNLEPLGRDLDRSSNRMSFAIVIAGVVIGSSVVVTADPSVQILGIRLQLFGMIGYLVAAILGLGLLWAIFRSGRLY